MAKFDIVRFEARIDQLLAAYRHLCEVNAELLRTNEALRQRGAEARQRLQALSRRLAALEQEADTRQLS